MSNAFLCPGQGSQTVGMLSEHLLQSEIVRSTFATANEVLGFDLRDIIANGPQEKLTQTQHAQPAILTCSVALARLLQDQGRQPTVTMGHSLGEYSALVIAGSMRFEDAVMAVHKRGTFMQEAVPEGVGTMAAVLGLEDSQVEEACVQATSKGTVAEPANYNCPGQLVISGHVAAVEKASQLCKDKGAKRVVPLNVSAPFHCSLLKPAADRLAEVLESMEFSAPNIPYIANVDAQVVRSAEGIKQRLIDQVYLPVRWTQSMHLMRKEFSPEQMFEVGPGRALAGFFKKIDRSLKVTATDKPFLSDELKAPR